MPQADPGLSEPLKSVEVGTKARHTPQASKETPYRTWRDNGLIASRAVVYLWPWKARDYPGLHKGMVLTLGRRVSRQTVFDWCKGRFRLSPWAAEALRDQIRARAMIGLAIADELDQHIIAESHRIKRRGGFGRGS